MGEDDAEEGSGRSVGDGAHEQAAGAAAFDGDASGVAVARAVRASVTAMKSVKVLRLVLHFAGVVPGVAELAAAANVGVGHDDAAIEQ